MRLSDAVHRNFETWFLKQTARNFRCGPSGGLLWIDQEVVTLRGLFGNSGLPARPSSRADSILTHR